jgi:hypothetical protein
VHDRRLGPSLVTFHIQLMWRNWLVAQLDAAEKMWVEPPVFDVGLSMMEAQNNLMWLPTVTNVPLLLALHNMPHAGLAAALAARAPVARAPAARTAAPASEIAPAAATARRDSGRQVRNPNRAPRFPLRRMCAPGPSQRPSQLQDPLPHGESEWSQWSLVHLLAHTWTML